MRIRRAKSRRTPHFANVIEHLESRCLLSGAGDLVGDTPLTASNLGILTAAQPLEVFATIDESFDLDVFQFQAGTQETATIELSANVSSLDTYLRLLDSSGNELAFDDDSGPGTNSLLRFTVNGGEIYFVEAGDFFDGTGDFFLEISLDAGDTIATATDLGLFTAIQPLDVFATIDAAFDRDVYQFQASTSATTTISLSANASSLDTVVTLLDSLGNVIASNDDRSLFSTDSLLTATVVEGETYFVETRGFSTSSGAFHLTIVAGDIGDTIGTATNLGFLTATQPLEVFSTIDVPFDRDVFQFQSMTQSAILIELSARLSSLDTIVTLLDSSGNVIASNDDSNSGTNSRLTVAIDGGVVYFVETRGFSTSSGGYQLVLRTVTDAVGNTTQTATDLGILTSTQPIEFLGSIEVPFDRDVFRFQAASEGPVVIELSADFSGLDTVVTLRDSSGAVVASNDDDGGSTNSRLNFRVVRGETYFVEAGGFSNSIGDYLLRITLDSGFPVESATNLRNLTATQPLMVSGTITALEIHDLFLFTALVNGTVEVRQVAAPVVGAALPFDGVLKAFDAGSSFPLAVDFGSSDTTIPRVVTFPVVAGQRYFAEVTGFGGSVGDYRLSIVLTVDDVPEAGRNLTGFSSANPTVLFGSIETRRDIDTYRFIADANRTLQISLNATAESALDPVLDVRVFAEDGSFFDRFVNNNFGFSFDSFVFVPVRQRQTIEIDARDFRSRRGDYQLTITGGGTVPISFPTVAQPIVHQRQSIEQRSTTDTFRFTATVGGLTTVEVNKVSDSLDPTVTIVTYDDPANPSVASFVASDDDSGRGLDSRVTFPAVVGQVYDLIVGGFGSTTGNFDVTLSLGSSDDVGNTFEVAAPLATQDDAFLLSENGTISAGGDNDVFSFIASFNGTLDFRASPFEADLRAGLSFFRASRTGNASDVELLAVAEPAAPGEQTSLLVPVNEGRTYFVRVVGLRNSNGDFTSGDYFLSANAVPDLIPASPSDAQIELVGSVGALSGQSVDFPSDRDWYRLVAPSSGEFTIRLDRTSGDLDPILTVYNEQELAVARNDDNGGFTLNSQITLQAQHDGELFYVEAAGINETTGDYQVTVQFTPHAADDFGNDSGHFSLIPVLEENRFAVQGLLDVTQDRDFFAFTAEVGGTVTVSLATRDLPLPPGVELRVFEAESTDLSNVSIENLTQVALIVTQREETALNLSDLSAQRSHDDVLQSSRHFVVAVSHVGIALNSPVNYSLSINVEPGQASEDLSLRNAALFALLSLADGVATSGERNQIVIRDALSAAINELGKTGDFLVVVIDPVNDPVLTDSQGRQSGFTSSNGTLNETPGGYVSVGSFGQVLIVPVSSAGKFELRFAGNGPDLAQSFSAFVIGPAGSQSVSQGQPRMTSTDGKTTFAVELSFGGIERPRVNGGGGGGPITTTQPPNVIPNLNSQLTGSESTTSRPDLGSSSPSFIRIVSLLLGSRQTSRNGRASTGIVAQSGIEDSTILRFEDGLRQSIDRQSDEPSGIDWPSLLDGVLERLQFDGNSRQSIRRLAEDLQGSRASIPLQFIRNSAVGRSAKAMYETLKFGAVAIGTGNPKLPVPKLRPLAPKATPASPASSR